MNQEQANRMEEMISTLITSLGSFRSEMISEITDMKSEITDIKSEITDMKSEIRDMKIAIKKNEKDIKETQLTMKEEFSLMRQENEERHMEIISRFEILEANQEHTWEKTVKNEREIAVMKKLAK